jgi:putative hydrolase of the HAD superfamily
MTIPTAVLFDIGGVIVTDGPTMSAVADVLGLPGDSATVARVHDAVWAARDEYDLGLGDAEYWARVAQNVGAPIPVGGVLEGLIDTDVRRWRSPDPGVVDFIERLASNGVVLGILSNAPHALARSFESQSWTKAFTAMTFSCDLGVAKPAPASYEAAVRAMGVHPSDVLFFDDRPENVEGAVACGLRGHVWTGLEDAEDVCR